MWQKPPHQSPTNTCIWCNNLFWEVQSCQRLQDHKKPGLNSPTPFRPCFYLEHALWQDQGFERQESKRGAARNSPSHKINLFSKAANSLLCLKLQGKLFGIRMTYGSCCPSANKPHLPLLPMSKCSGAHLSAWRIIKVIIALLLTGIKLTAFQNHNRAISNPLAAVKLSFVMLWGFSVWEEQSATHLTSTVNFY